MLPEKQSPLVAELRRQLNFLDEIYELTAALVVACNSEQQLALLLSQRQQLMSEATKSRLISQQLREVAPPVAESAVRQELLEAMGELLEKTAGLDRQLKQELELRRDRVKQELVQLQAGKAASKAYTTEAPQEEGFFLDWRKN